MSYVVVSIMGGMGRIVVGSDGKPAHVGADGPTLNSVTLAQDFGTAPIAVQWLPASTQAVTILPPIAIPVPLNVDIAWMAAPLSLP